MLKKFRVKKFHVKKSPWEFPWEISSNPANSHLNTLTKFANYKNFDVLHQPSSCAKSENRPLIIFGIKSMPDKGAMRDAIRKTWLDRNYWSALGVNIHIVFLTGRTSGNEFDDEIRIYDDILQINITESHYLLPVKERCSVFVRFLIQSKAIAILNPEHFTCIVTHV